MAKKCLELPVGLTSLIVAVCVFHFCTETYQLRLLHADVHNLQSPENLSVCLTLCTVDFDLGIANNTVVLNNTLYVFYDMIYLLTAAGLTPGGNSTVHIYTHTVHNTTK